jgi:3-oxoacyl-[acyl-carrier protein] reductase
MDKKFALIVGGSGGIGIETAVFLFKKGFEVGLTYHKNVAHVQEKLNENGVKCAGLYCLDVVKEEDVKKMVSLILRDKPCVDYVIYCVSGPLLNKRLGELHWNEFQEHVDVQVRGFFNLVKEFWPLISKKNRMKFIVVLSESCIGKPPSMLSHYVTAKYALMGFVKCMAVELAPYNCMFNMVSPGMVRTGLISNMPAKLVELVEYNNPMKRIATPADVAKVISFLASDDSDYLNGVNIPVNGGNIFI